MNTKQMNTISPTKRSLKDNEKPQKRQCRREQPQEESISRLDLLVTPANKSEGIWEDMDFTPLATAPVQILTAPILISTEEARGVSLSSDSTIALSALTAAPAPALPRASSAKSPAILPTTKSTRALFVVKVFNLLQSGDNKHIISWYQHDSFVIWDRELLAKEILPKLFNHNNIASFERQLNFYSFSKMSIDEDTPSSTRLKKNQPRKFKHSLFTRNAPLAQIERIYRTTSTNFKTDDLEKIHATLAQRVNALESTIARKETLKLALREQLDALNYESFPAFCV